MAVRSLKFVLTGDDRSASKALGKVSKSADKLDSRLGSLAGGLAGGALAAGVISFGKSSVSAFKEAEQAQASFNAAFEKFPKLADTNAKALSEYNSALAKKTIYDDDAIGSGQAVLAQFNLTGKQIKKITPLLLDYASKTGTDLPTAATNLGRAFMGNTRALKNLGINYKSTGNAGKDFENIQTLLNQKVGGFAEKEGKTAAGQAKILGNQYGELQEVVGSKMVPALNKMAGGLLDVLDFSQRNSTVIKPLVITVGGFAAAVWGVNKAVIAWKATEKAFLVVKGLFTTAVIAEGAAVGTTATAVTGLAAAETAAGAAGTAGAVGVGLFAGSVSALAASFTALVASGYFAWKFGDLALHAGEGGGDFAHQPLDPHQSGGSANSGSRGTMIGPGAKPDTRFVQPRHFGLAKGGPMRAGRSYLVGEDGPEMVTPRRSGYVHTAKQTQGMKFNPNVRLDTSQVVDNRLLTGMLTGSYAESFFGRIGREQNPIAPPGMRDYINYRTPTRHQRIRYEDGSYGYKTVVVKVDMSRSKVSKQLTSEQRRRGTNGHPRPFGL